jgi:hypothetical protein
MSLETTLTDITARLRQGRLRLVPVVTLSLSKGLCRFRSLSTTRLLTEAAETLARERAKSGIRHSARATRCIAHRSSIRHSAIAIPLV